MNSKKRLDEIRDKEIEEAELQRQREECPHYQRFESEKALKKQILEETRTLYDAVFMGNPDITFYVLTKYFNNVEQEIIKSFIRLLWEEENR